MAITTLLKKVLSYPWDKTNSGLIKTWVDAINTKVNAIVEAESGFLTADAAGRGIMANDYLDADTVARVVDAKAITAASIADATITVTQLANNAVETAKIKDANVTTAKITDANVTAAKLAAVLCSAPSTRSGAGAIPITAPTCLFTSTGATQALTIADGTFAGQKLRINHAVDGGSGVITQTTGAKLTAGVTTITFTNVREYIDLEWTGALWAITGGTATVA